MTEGSVRLLRGRGDEEGSVLLLILGSVALGLTVLFVSVCATDLYLAQKRLDSLADAAALAGADGFTLVVEGEDARAVLSDEGVRAQAQALWDALPRDAVLVSAGTPDGNASRVTVSTLWRPPLLAPFVPEGVRLEATGTSRTALQ